MHRKQFPVDLARAGEARHFIAWTGAVSGLRGGSLSDLAVAGLRGGSLSEFAVAAEALLTDVLLSVDEGTLQVESGVSGDTFELTMRYPEMHDRRMAGLEGIMEQYLDGHELSPTEAVLLKRLG